MQVIERARILDKGGQLIFPSPKRHDCSLSDATLTKVLRNMGLAGQATMHGLRHSFRDWCSDTAQPRVLAEAALAHTEGGV